MFSLRQKRELSDGIQKLIRATGHPELPPEGEEIEFLIRIEGMKDWSWAEIRNNRSVKTPSMNEWNEAQDLESD